MSPHPCFTMRGADYCAAIAATVILSFATAQAQQAAAPNDTQLGQINFDVVQGTPPLVELDLTAGMFDVMFGLSDAAIAGVAESLAQSPDAGQGAQMAAHQLAATRQMIDLVKEVVHELRVRVYEGPPADAAQPLDLGAQFESQLRAGKWDTVVQTREKNNRVQVSLLQRDSAVRGVFIVAMDGNNVVLLNAVCDVSPENVKRITSAATKIGMESGLNHMIEAKLRELQPPQPVTPPMSPPPTSPPPTQ